MASHVRERKRCLEILGLAHSASEDDVRKAYRSLALQFHPDKNKSEDATERFQEIQGAYRYLTEGSSVHMHMHEDSDDDDGGIPFFILVRLFPWLFTGHGGAAPSRRPFDPFGYDSDSDEDDFGFFFGSQFGNFQFVHHATGPRPSYSRGQGRGSTSRPDTAPSHSQYGATSTSSSDKARRKQEKKKMAKQRKKAEKNAAQATSSRTNNDTADNFPTTPTSNWGLSKDPKQQASKTEQKSKEAEKARMEAERTKQETKAKKEAAERERKEVEREKIEARKAAEKVKKEEEKAERAKREADKAKIEAEKAVKEKQEVEKRKKEAEEAERARREAEKIEKAREAERVKQQMQEERKRRMEEKAQTAKELEEMVRADKEKKERRLAAQKEKERREAEERARKEEQEIAEQAQRLREEQQKKEEELARRKQEEEDQREMAQLLNDFDNDLYMDAKGEFVTLDTDGVGSIKKQPVMYDASGYASYTAEEEMSVGDGGDNHRFEGHRGWHQGYRGRSQPRGRGRGRGHTDFHSPPPGFTPNSPPFKAWDSPPPPHDFPNFGYPPPSPGSQQGGFTQRGDRGRGGQGFQGGSRHSGFHEMGRGESQGFQNDRGHGFQTNRGHGRGQSNLENRGHGFQGQQGSSDDGVMRDCGFDKSSYVVHSPPQHNQCDSAFNNSQGVNGNHHPDPRQPPPAQQQASSQQAFFQGGQHPNHTSNIQQQFSGLYQSSSVPNNNNNSSNKSNPHLHSSNLPPSSMPPPPRPLQKPPGLMMMGYGVGGNRGPPRPPSSSSVAPPPGMQRAPPGAMPHPPFLHGQPPPLLLRPGFNVPPPPTPSAGTESIQRVRPPPLSTPNFGGGGGHGLPGAQLNHFNSTPQFAQQSQPQRFSTTAPPNPFLMSPGLRQQRPYIPPFGNHPGMNSIRNFPQKTDSGGLLPRPGGESSGVKSGMNTHANPGPPACSDGQGGLDESNQVMERSSSEGVHLYGLDDIDD